MEPNTLKQTTNVREEKGNALSTLASLENEEKRKKIGLIHRAYLTQLQNARVYTASTKTKSEVRGGGKKPWRQKGEEQSSWCGSSSYIYSPAHDFFHIEK
jgi:ribosomal protein L4